MDTQDSKDQEGRQGRRRRTRRVRGAELSTPYRVALPFPDLEALTPVERPSNPERVLWRLAAFYDVVRDAMGRDRYPHPLGVWLNPADADRLRRWVEAPMSIRLKVGQPVKRRSSTRLYWIDKGPATSPLVPPGEIIITDRAYEGLQEGERGPGVR